MSGETCHSDNGNFELDVIYLDISFFSDQVAGNHFLLVVVNASNQKGFVPKPSEVGHHSLGDELLTLAITRLVHYDADSFLQ